MSSTDLDTAAAPTDELDEESHVELDKAQPTSESVAARIRARLSVMTVALALAGLAAVALGGYAGWATFGVVQMDRAEHRGAMSVGVASKLAVDLTTIDWQHPEADVQKIVDATTGTFREDFIQRAPAFIDMVKQARSKTTGTVTEAGLELTSESEAQVLVAVTVVTATDGEPDQEQKAWRMRISVENAATDPKVTNVVFVA